MSEDTRLKAESQTYIVEEALSRLDNAVEDYFLCLNQVMGRLPIEKPTNSTSEAIPEGKCFLELWEKLPDNINRYVSRVQEMRCDLQALIHNPSETS